MSEFIGKAAKNGLVSYILNACATLLGVIALICYCVSAEDKSQMTETEGHGSERKNGSFW